MTFRAGPGTPLKRSKHSVFDDLVIGNLSQRALSPSWDQFLIN